nr:unnamed protein product [Callosobruchus analis]
MSRQFLTDKELEDIILNDNEFKEGPRVSAGLEDSDSDLCGAKSEHTDHNTESEQEFSDGDDIQDNSDETSQMTATFSMKKPPHLFMFMVLAKLVPLCLCVIVSAQEWSERNPWTFDPQITRQDDGNLRSDIEVKHSGEQHDFNAGFSQVLTGPKVDPTWHVGAKIRFRRSPGGGQPWEVNPSVSKRDDGNTVGRVEVKRRGDNTDVEAGYGKVFRGPGRGQETWHVAATHRWRRDASPIITEVFEEGTEVRNRRSLQPMNGNPWEVSPSISKGNDGNTEGRVEVKRTGKNTDIGAGYGKVIRGPNRGRETWHVGATHRWRRDVPPMVSEFFEENAEVRNKQSLQPTNGNPWEVNPSISKGNDGNTEGRVEVKRTGENTDVNAGYGKVIRGPNRGRETWHVGATHRWRREVPPMVSEFVEENSEVRNRRSLQPTNGNPWEVNPSISKGNDGNTEGRVEVKRTGENTDVNAGYGKVIRGPNRGRETWHVGATHRWRREVPPMVSEFVEENAEVRNKRSLQPTNGNPWEVNPSISKGNDGNTEGRVEVKRTGENTDVNAGYGKVIRGPNRGRETWHVGATHRWRREVPPMVSEFVEENAEVRNRRSLQPTNGNPWEVNPSISKGNDGNTEGRVEVKRTGENTDVNAGYAKVIRGPNRGRETWHVGATHRWRREVPPMVSEFVEENAEVRNRRSLQPTNGNPWEVNPSISKGNDGNTEGRVEVKRTGENTDANAGYSKVIRGPNRGRETWRVGATHRW